MDKQEQIELLLQAMSEAQPKDLARFMSESQAGIKAVLRLLYMADGPVSAGTIAEEIDVSNARVAVLLKKMAAKDLIVRETDPNDARVSFVRLTEHGIHTVELVKTELYEQISAVIDKVGWERMMEFVSISKEIQDVLNPPALPL